MQRCAKLALTVVADFLVPQDRLWDAYADPRQLERFWGPPTWPASFTYHDLGGAGPAEDSMTGPNGDQWSGSWDFTGVNPIGSFEAHDGEDDAEDENPPAPMKFAFEATPTGSRSTCTMAFSSVEAREHGATGIAQRRFSRLEPEITDFLYGRKQDQGHRR